jgi:hypothetical protein
MSDFLKKYGSRELRVGTLLWTNKPQEQWDIPQHEVFFHVNTEPHTLILGGEYSHQVVLVNPVTLITPFTGYAYTMYLNTRLDELCNDLGVSGFDDSNDIDFKESIVRRRPLIESLLNLGIDGWYHPVENNASYMEVCLFNASHNTVKTSLVDYYYPHDSYEDIVQR